MSKDNIIPFSDEDPTEENNSEYDLEVDHKLLVVNSKAYELFSKNMFSEDEQYIAKLSFQIILTFETIFIAELIKLGLLEYSELEGGALALPKNIIYAARNLHTKEIHIKFIQMKINTELTESERVNIAMEHLSTTVVDNILNKLNLRQINVLSPEVEFDLIQSYCLLLGYRQLALDDYENDDPAES